MHLNYWWITYKMRDMQNLSVCAWLQPVSLTVTGCDVSAIIFIHFIALKKPNGEISRKKSLYEKYCLQRPNKCHLWSCEITLNFNDYLA